MVIAIVLVLLFALFFFLRRHIGPCLLAVIAGLSVYEMFGPQLIDFIQGAASSVSRSLLETVVYLCFVLAFPLILYFRSSRGGLFGVLRIAAAALLAALLTSLLAPSLANIFFMDGLSQQILEFIATYKGWILVGGITVAYFDILFYRGQS